MGLISRLERVPGTVATHSLQLQGYSCLKGCQGYQQLTNCQAKGGLDQQVQKGARGSRNSQAAEPRVNLVSKLERVPGTAVTDMLQSQEVGLLSRLEKVPGTATTYSLQSQEWTAQQA